MQKRRRKRLQPILTILAVLGVLCAWAFYRGIVTTRYVIRSSKLPQEKFRIALIADLHSCVFGEKQTDLLRLLASEKPDIIVLAGDIADEWSNPIAGMQWLVEGAVQLAPCYYVTGNHEFWSMNVPALKTILREAGVTVLEGDILPVSWGDGGINLCGLDDPDGVQRDRRSHYLLAVDEFSALSHDDFTILIAHRPEYIEEYARYPFDLVLSGHTHGGQVRIPLFLNGLFAPDQGWMPRYAGGRYQVANTTLIVSRGISYYPQLPRIFNPPELVIIDLLR